MGGVLLGSTVAAGAAYLAVRYANSAAAADELRRGGSQRRRPGRCVLQRGVFMPLCVPLWYCPVDVA